MYIPLQEEAQQHLQEYLHWVGGYVHTYDLEKEQQEGEEQQVVGQEQLVNGYTVVHYTWQEQEQEQGQGQGQEQGQGQMDHCQEQEQVQMDHCQEQGMVYVVEHPNLWGQFVLERVLHEGLDDSGGYPKCDCHVPNSGLQFEHVEGYLEEFLPYTILNVNINNNKKEINFYTYILRNQRCWG